MSGTLRKVVIVNYSFMLDCIALHDSQFYISAPREKEVIFLLTLTQKVEGTVSYYAFKGGC